jgi:hypothetical protein
VKRDKSESAAKERETLKAKEKMREENKVGVQVLQKLGISLREPAGQKGGDLEAG